jgi:hypothetical protein
MSETSVSPREIDPGASEFHWRISSSCSGGNCVEVGVVTDGSKRVAIRRKRDLDTPILFRTLNGSRFSAP